MRGSLVWWRLTCALGFVIGAGCADLEPESPQDASLGKVSQALPGGVATTPYVWLSSDSLSSLSSGAVVSTWTDTGGGSRNATEVTNGGSAPVRPTAQPNVMNFHRAVRFTDPDSNNRVHLRVNSAPPSGNMTLLAVFATTQTDTSGAFWSAPAILGAENGGTQNDFSLGHAGGRVFMKAEAGDGFGAQSPVSPTYNDGVPHIALGTRVQNGDQVLFMDGTSIATDASDNNILSDPSTLGIGNHDDSVTTAQFAGDIAEVVVYGSEVTSTERQRIESYLAIKYGITLSHNYFDSAGNTVWTVGGGYDNDITGLGRDTTIPLDQRVSKSANSDNVVTIALQNDFVSENDGSARTVQASNGDYLVWGNDNGAVTFSSDRLTRVFRVVESNTDGTDLGSVFVQFNTASITSGTRYCLVVDNDGNFTNGGTSYGNCATASGTSVVIAHDFNDTTAPYFTLSNTISDVGCSDGQREGWTSTSSYPNIAGCSGSWSVPGLKLSTGAQPAAACNRNNGDDLAGTGTGCSATDLCGSGWSICGTTAKVTASSSTGCTGATGVGDPNLFFASGVSGNGSMACTTTATDANDIFGCGNYGSTPGASCSPLDRFSHNLCNNINTPVPFTQATASAQGSPWACGLTSSAGTTEAQVVAKTSNAGGGVMCCRDTSVACDCLIGGACYASGAQNPDNSCQVCTPGTSTTAWSNAIVGTSCNDGSACSINDQCNGSGSCGGGATTEAICGTADKDGDGILNSVECPTPSACVNTDGTGNADFDDPDSDDDGVCDGSSAVPSVCVAGPDTGRTNTSLCRDSDADTCDDCVNVHTVGGSTTNDGTDFESDGLCDAGDPNDDNDSDPDVTDCNDANNAIFTGAVESCDAVDQDCDGDLVDGFANFDGDANPDCVDTDDDGDGDPDVTDCNDGDSAIFTGATEACDAVDQDCDGDLVDGFANFDGDANPDCVDADDDGDGDPDVTDCNDANNAIFTGATEACDAVDQDCDGDLVDGFANFDGDANPDCVDTDDDGDGDPDVTDCNDASSAIFTGAPEVCDTIDQDCDNDLVEGFANFDGDGTPDCADADDDDDGDPDLTDCNDANNAIFTGAVESCDAVDQDCDGDLVDGFANFDGDANPDCVDTDDDGDGDPDVTDCNDANNAIFTGAIEVCDAIDQDCDNNLVEGFANFDGDANPDCVDTDDDGDGDPDVTDCNDTNNAIFTGAVEACDAVDQDCDGDLVDGFANFDGDSSPDCVDTDDDGDGDPDVTDCNDANNAIFAGAVEVCDAVDQDCDGDLVDGFANFDGDANPDCVDTDDDGDGDPDVTDCNDASDAIFTGAPELCDAIDQDCDGDLVEGFANLDGDATPDCADLDGDGDGDPDVTDCNDTDNTIFAGATEACDAVDQDCDGDLVDGFANTDADPQPDCVDTDDDGDGDPDLTDCSDTDDAIFTGATEACDAVDQDCDGDLVDGFANFDGDAEPDCVDTDDDADGDADLTDCNDADNAVFTGATETCDAVDQDCDGDLVDGFANFDGDAEPDCVDADDDNDGDPDLTDCNDQDATVLAGASETVCNGIDNDCNGIVDQDGPENDPACTGKDADGDGYLNGEECPTSAACVDTDDDGTPDFLDQDSDEDGTADSAEDAPERTDPCAPNFDVLACADGDRDGDGVRNGVECADVRACSDSDRDGDPDYDDTDADADGLLDRDECADDTACPDSDADGLPDRVESAVIDTDGDSDLDFEDEDADDDGTLDSDECSVLPCEDADDDGIPDYLDAAADGPDAGDSDGDGLNDDVECSSGYVCVDTDGDAIPDYFDLDSDGDGVDDSVDDGVLDPCEPEVDSLACQNGDADKDGTPNGMDPEANNPCVPSPNVLVCGAGDADGDGISNQVECPNTADCPDTDADNTPDYQDTDSDGDGQTDGVECPNTASCADADNDGLPDFIESDDIDSDGDGQSDENDVDSDGDGTNDGVECAVLPCLDADGDGIPDVRDAVDDGTNAGDSDGDGINDDLECSAGYPCPDTDGDGTPDYADPDSDNDGEPDGSDSEQADPCIPDENALACGSGDKDRDGVSNASDTAPSDPCAPDPDALACDSGDADQDGVNNGDDDQPEDPCVPSSDFLGCDSGDADGDGVPNGVDGKPLDPCVPNPDTDGCPVTEPDDDAGMPQEPEPDASVPGGDQDGGVSVADAGASSDAGAGSDSDGDGVPDDVECTMQPCEDSDDDGTPDYLDDDDDNDGIPTADEPSDADGDGIPDRLEGGEGLGGLAGGAGCAVSGASSACDLLWLGLVGVLMVARRRRSATSLADPRI